MSPTPDFIQRANAPYIEAMYERYRSDPAAVPPDWAAFFAGFDLAGVRPGGAAAGQAAGAVVALVQNYRAHGHLAARIDPLGSDSDPAAPGARLPLLDPAHLGITAADLAQPAPENPFRGAPAGAGTLADLVAALQATYSGTIGVESAELTDPERRAWLEERMEPVRNRPERSPEDRRHILSRLITADGFEEFLQLRYPGQKRFSLEGAGTLLPMLDTLVERAATTGVEQIVIGMPHRGRLNVLANLLQKPLETVFREFDARLLPEHVQGHGDVKYHLGESCTHRTRDGREIHLDLNFNPSHLEFVNPVVLGAVRARQERMGDAARRGGFAVLIHGDAGFSGEGVVPETLAMAGLPHYDTGGTVHLIVNNQIGFTTSPADARRSRYATDIAHVEDAPIFHVNGDDPEAAVHVIEIAVDYRTRFGRDVFVDLVCFRKHGHNELDDPTFTQPVMYRAIAAHPSVSTLYAGRLAAEGVITASEAKEERERIHAGFAAAHGRARREPEEAQPAPLGGAWTGLEWAGDDWSAATAVPRDRLERITAALAALPEGFHAHRKVIQLAAERVRMLEEDRVDWGLGEALAFGTLLLEGRHARLSGQDTGRGTFSHRHAVLHDQEDDRRWIPLQHLAPAQGRFEVFDTPLSEAGPLGFEYGYSTADPHTLVVWEAQFGDFGNVAQVYIDQFLASAESKWRRMSGLTLLLPHGYEGQGPEHSSARLERFLELCANGNLQVCNLTTPAQLFHALRRQLLRSFRKPLVIMSPKSLLRHKLAVSPAAEFTAGGFHTLLDDPAAGDAQEVRAVVLVSGKLYYALLEARAAAGTPGFALVRVEQLYPFPAQELRGLFARYPQARDVRWVQEEPANMGAWRSTRHRIEAVLPPDATLRLVARQAAPSPATGYYPLHVEQERRLVERALAAERSDSEPDLDPDPDPRSAGAPARAPKGAVPSVPGEGEKRIEPARRHGAGGARGGGRR